MQKRNKLDTSRGKIGGRLQLNGESENKANSLMSKKLQRNCMMLPKSVLEDAVGVGPADPHCGCTCPLPRAPRRCLRSRRGSGDGGESRVPLRTLMGTELLYASNSLRNTLPILGGQNAATSRLGDGFVCV